MLHYILVSSGTTFQKGSGPFKSHSEARKVMHTDSALSYNAHRWLLPISQSDMGFPLYC